MPSPHCPQIIDPFVEVEVIGLPVDCSKEQTRVVDDNGEHPNDSLCPCWGSSPVWQEQASAHGMPQVPWPLSPQIPGCLVPCRSPVTGLLLLRV